MVTWMVNTVDGGHVRLTSGTIGLDSIDVTAPVSGGELILDGESASFSLRLDLQRLKTGNFLMQAAARSLVSSHDVHVLVYQGSGTADGAGWQVSGTAVAGTIEVPLTLAIVPVGKQGDDLREIEISGSASVGRVSLPLPGLGTVDDFGFNVDARLALNPHSH